MVANHGKLSLEVHPHSRAICIFLKLEMRIRGGEAAMVATPTSEAKNAQVKTGRSANCKMIVFLPRWLTRVPLGDTFVLSHSNVGGRNTLVAAVLGYLGIRNANLIKYRIRSSAGEFSVSDYILYGCGQLSDSHGIVGIC
ncbi:Uncharacterized protein TPS_00720 [Trichinella pseudospiralis]